MRLPPPCLVLDRGSALALLTHLFSCGAGLLSAPPPAAAAELTFQTAASGLQWADAKARKPTLGRRRSRCSEREAHAKPRCPFKTHPRATPPTPTPAPVAGGGPQVGTGAPLSAGMRVNIDYVMSTTGARYGAKIDSTVDRQARPRGRGGDGKGGVLHCG